MGIARVNKILSRYTDTCALERVAELSRVRAIDVCFDGSLFVFNGCVESSVVEKSSAVDGTTYRVYDEECIAETSFAVLQSHVLVAKSTLNVNKFLFYIDGVKPRLKMHTMQKRKHSIRFSPAKAMALLCKKICERMAEVEIVNLLLGEAEHEFFTRRDWTRPNLLITDDTDLFHIAYKYTKQTDHDVVFLCKKHFTNIYDMSRVNCNMPKLLFATVLFMKGSDFTDSLITDSMCDAIFTVYNRLHKKGKFLLRYMTAIRDVCNRYADREAAVQTLNCADGRYRVVSLNQQHDYSDDEQELEHVAGVYRNEDVRTLVSYLLLMLLYAQKTKLVKFRWNNASIVGTDDEHVATDTADYLDTLTWSVNYSLIGARYAEYANPRISFSKIHSLNFYLDVLSTNEEFVKVMFRHSMIDLKMFKEICAPTVLKFYRY